MMRLTSLLAILLGFDILYTDFSSPFDFTMSINSVFKIQ